jgi:RHS repeat-associated protein
MAVNGTLSGASTGTTNFTAYVNPYTVINNGNQMSKHIYVGTQRIMSKLCDAGAMADPTTATKATYTGSTLKYADKYTTLTNTVKARYDSLGVAYNGVDNKGIGFYKASSSTPSGAGGSYYYHSDHLGSANYITDETGSVAQHLEYIPYGETFVDERYSTWHSPYKFNGKERDEETGLTYYSQRYFDGNVWYTSDELKHKHPNIGSYVYCAGNPVKYIDPDGRDWFVNSKNGNVIFLRGVNKLNNESREKYGLGQGKYENIGKDNMFGKNLKEIKNRNVLTFDGPHQAEKFMNKHGYVKAEGLKVSETKIENTDYGHIGVYNPDPVTTTTLTEPLITDKRLTYVLPELLNTKSNIRTDVGIGTFNSIETTTYDLIKPINQSVNASSVYQNENNSIKWDRVSQGIQTFFDVAPYILNLIRK